MIRVEDNGPGIPHEIMERIRDPFFTTKHEGTGLGLYVARRVAEDHRGVLDIRSAPGGGVVVTLILPVTPSDMSAPRAGGSANG